VAIVAGIPGLGTFAYTLAKPLRQQRALGAIALDQLLRHVSMRAYHGFHLDTLTLWMAQSQPVALAAGLMSRAPGRLRSLGGTLAIASIAFFVNAGLISAAVALDTPERSTAADVAGTLLFVEVVIAGAAGCFAFRNYWKRQASPDDLNEAAGMFLWGFGALFIIGVGIDYGLGVHETLFGFTAEHFNVFPLLTDPSEHLIALGYATLAIPFLFLLRHELISSRASATWLSVALIGGALLVTSVSLQPLSDLTILTQALTGGALLAAFGTRLVETLQACQSARPVRSRSRIWSLEFVCIAGSPHVQG
jgi:hypothetical protein